MASKWPAATPCCRSRAGRLFFQPRTPCTALIFFFDNTMRRLLSTFGTAALASTLLIACNPQNQAPAGKQAGSAPAAVVGAGHLPIAQMNDEQLQTRWNQLATSMSMEKMKLHDCKPAPAPAAGQSVVLCHSAPRSVVYFVRTNGQVTQVQFTSLLGFFSVSLPEASKFMARFLHEGTHGDDVTLVDKFVQEASRNKRFCVPSPAVQSQMCYLTDGRSFGVEIR